MDQLKQEVSINDEIATRAPKKPGIEDILALAGRAPASEDQAPALPPVVQLAAEQSKTTTEEPTRLGFLQSEYKKAKEATQAAQAAYAARLLAEQQKKPELKGISEEVPLTEKAYDVARERLSQMAEKPAHNLLAEAILAFAPTLLGYGLGRAAGGVGSAEAGIAAGAQAGLAGLQKMTQEQQDEFKRQKELLSKVELQRAEDIAKAERLKKEAEAKMASAYQVKSLEAQYPYLGKNKFEDLPERIALELAQKGESATLGALLQAAGKGRKIETEVTGTQQKIAPPPKPTGDLAFKNLPKEQQIIVTDLAKSQASILGVASTLEANIRTLENPKISVDQKVTAGRMLYKVLNMKDGTGRDAIGREESQRIGAFLQAKMGNLTDVGSFFRSSSTDLGEFIQQVKISLGVARYNADLKQLQIDDIHRKYEKGYVEKSPAPVAAPSAAPSGKPDFNRYSDEELKKYLGK